MLDLMGVKVDYILPSLRGPILPVGLNYDLRHEDTNCDPDKWVPISDINFITRS